MGIFYSAGWGRVGCILSPAGWDGVIFALLVHIYTSHCTRMANKLLVL